MSENIDFKALRESLTPEDIKRILAEYGVEPKYENVNYIQFPTCCHNIDGGSPKLYYYKNTYLFRCYTECDSSFDIVELLIKMNDLRGIESNKIDIAKKLGYDFTNTFSTETEDSVNSNYYNSFINATTSNYWPELSPIVEINREILNRYIYNEQYLQPWIDEGISREMLQQFEIKYDPINTAIVIPHKDVNGKIVGVRGRFMSEDAVAKYMPIQYNNTFLAHPLGSNLYGIHENIKPLQKFKTAIIFESEKSVLKLGSYFGPESNFSVATCGNKISNEQIQLLLSIGVTHVVLAFDKDYHGASDMGKVQSNYEKIGKQLSNYFTTSIMLDFGSLLEYKDSPVDRGKAIFEELYRYRYFV